MQVLWSSRREAAFNLAAEDWWLDHFATAGRALLFYVNGPSIVVGKNQNPWREAATGWARREGIAVRRRVSGGGTVWHDEGNLNFCLVLPRTEYCRDRVFDQTLAALASLEVEAEVAHGNSLFVRGRKISGTAFCYRGNAVMHHGTLLVNADLERLRRALQPALPQVETRAIASRPAPVANLSEYTALHDLTDIARALAIHLAGTETWRTFDPAELDGLCRMAEKHAEQEWIFGATPAFSWIPFVGGPQLHVEKGVVTRVDRADGGSIEPWFPTPFSPADLAAALARHDPAWAASLAEFDW